MHDEKSREPLQAQNRKRDSIALHRDPLTDEWVFDLSPGLDLIEVARVLAVVQHQALQLLQQQIHTWQPASNSAPLFPVSGSMVTAATNAK